MTNPMSFHFTQEAAVHIYDQTDGFASVDELKSAVRDFFADFQCPKCNGHQCTGDFIGIVFRENRLHKEVKKTQTTGIIFRTTKDVYEDEFIKSIWRVESVQLRQKDGGWGILSDETEGYIKCNRKDCNWEVRGGTKAPGRTIRYMSILDIDQAIKKSLYGFTNDTTDANMIWDAAKRRYVGHIES